MADKECNGNSTKAAKALVMSGYLLPCLVSAIIVWYIATRETPRRLDKHEVKIEAAAVKLNSHDISIKVLESDLGHIRTGIDRIETAISKLERSRRSKR